MGFPKGCPCTPASPSLSECNSPPRRRPNSQGLGQIEAPPPAVHARKNAPKMHAVHECMDSTVCRPCTDGLHRSAVQTTMDCRQRQSMHAVHYTWTADTSSPSHTGLQTFAIHPLWTANVCSPRHNGLHIARTQEDMDCMQLQTMLAVH